MATMDYKAGFCNNCEEGVKVERKSTNHILHLILTIFTGCLWLPIWILLSLPFIGDHWRCAKCGSRRIKICR